MISKAGNNSGQRNKSKTLFSGSNSGLHCSSARKTSVFSDARSLPHENLPAAPPPPLPFSPPTSTVQIAVPLQVAVSNDEEPHSVINCSHLANSISVMSDVTAQVPNTEVPLQMTPPPTSRGMSLPLAATPLASIPSSSSRLGITCSSLGNSAAGIMVETVSNRRIFHQTDSSSSGTSLRSPIALDLSFCCCLVKYVLLYYGISF